MSLNLLPSQAKFQMEKIRAQALSRKILTWFISVWMVVVLGIFGALFTSQWLLNNKNEAYKNMVSDYLQSSNEIVASQTIKFRAKLLSKVLADRFEYADAFAIAGNAFDSTIKIRDFELKDKQYFVMSVIASDANAVSLLESRAKEVNAGLDPNIKKMVIKGATYFKTDKTWLVNLEVFI